MRVERIQPDLISMDEISRAARESNISSVAQTVPASDDNSSQEPQQVSSELINSKTKQLNQAMEIFNHKVRFKIHDDPNQVIIQIVDSDTDKIVQEIPPEKFLDMVASMEKAVGLIVDKKL